MLAEPSYFIDTAPTEIYTLSLHDALPISSAVAPAVAVRNAGRIPREYTPSYVPPDRKSTTSELQSRRDLVCRLLLEKKKLDDPLYNDRLPMDAYVFISV